MSCPALPVTVNRFLWLPACAHGSVLPMTMRGYSSARVRRHDRINRSQMVSIIFTQNRSVNPDPSWEVPGDFGAGTSLV